MKPIVIYPTNKDNKISLTKQEFEDYLKQAYDSGYADGYSAGCATVNQWWNTPVTVPTTTPIVTWEKTSTPYDPYKITCDAHNDL